VQTSNGLKKVEELEEGDFVLGEGMTPIQILKREIESYNWLEVNMEKIFDLLSKLNRLVTVAKYSVMFDDAFSGRVVRDNNTYNTNPPYGSNNSNSLYNFRSIPFKTLAEAKEKLIDEIIAQI
jgi:hypothetical protein